MAMSYKERAERIKANKAALQKMESEHQEATRKRETRRLILIGRLAEKWMEWGKLDRREFMHSMDRFLSRNYDRDLFDLEKLPEDNLPKKTKQSATKDTRPIQMPMPPAAATEKPDVARTMISGKKLAEVGVKPEDFLLQ